jgi:photosystem II stability/assembly factor-like uncharacterized protein
MIQVKLVRRRNSASNWDEFCFIDADTGQILVWFGMKYPTQNAVTKWVESQIALGNEISVPSSLISSPKNIKLLKGEKGETGVLATGKTGKFKVTNFWIEPETGKFVVEYDDTIIP